MKKLINLKLELNFNFEYSMKIIEATFQKECRRQVFQHKDNYSICAGMGVFAVYLDGKSLYIDDLPKRLLVLNKYWGSIVNSYNYYMYVNLIEKG